MGTCRGHQSAPARPLARAAPQLWSLAPEALKPGRLQHPAAASAARNAVWTWAPRPRQTPGEKSKLATFVEVNSPSIHSINQTNENIAPPHLYRATRRRPPTLNPALSVPLAGLDIHGPSGESASPTLRPARLPAHPTAPHMAWALPRRSLWLPWPHSPWPVCCLCTSACGRDARFSSPFNTKRAWPGPLGGPLADAVGPSQIHEVVYPQREEPFGPFPNIPPSIAHCRLGVDRSGR